MTPRNSTDAATNDASPARVRINPAAVIGLGAFGGLALSLTKKSLHVVHPLLHDTIAWLWLKDGEWEAPPETARLLNAAAESNPPAAILEEPLSQALDKANSEATVSRLGRAGFDTGPDLDILLLARADDPLARGALWPLLALLRAQARHLNIRVTLLLACNSRRFSESHNDALASFFDRLANRLTADRSNPVSGAVTWCYLCDTLDARGRQLEPEGEVDDAVRAQAGLCAGFAALLLGSALRRDPIYAGTGLPQVAQEIDAPPDAALVSSFGLQTILMPQKITSDQATERLAARLHAAVYPRQASPTDAEAVDNACQRLTSAFDLSPRGLRIRLLQGADADPIQFTTCPPKVGELDSGAATDALARWRDELAQRWQHQADAPPSLIANNAEAFCAQMETAIQREVATLSANGAGGHHRALGLLEALPQLIEEARVQTVSDDRYYRKTALPAVEDLFNELNNLSSRRKDKIWRAVGWVSLLFVLAIAAAALIAPGLWPPVLALWLATLPLLPSLLSWWHQRSIAKRQTEIIQAVQQTYHHLLERETRVQRRRLFDALLNIVRRSRRTVVGWHKEILAARALLDPDKGNDSLTEAQYGEQLLRGPKGDPPPGDAYDEGRIHEIVEQFLDRRQLPPWPEVDATAINDWLRDGAAKALGDWQASLETAAWSDPEPARAIRALMREVRPQWPVKRGERPPVAIDIVGFAPGTRPLLPRRRPLVQRLVATTSDPARFSFAPTCHGLELRRLAAMRPLWQSLPDQ